MIKHILIITFIVQSIFSQAQGIRVNQVGYYPAAKKYGVAVDLNGSEGNSFDIIDLNDENKVVFTADLGSEVNYSLAQEDTRIADFSSFTIPGRYKLKVGSVESYDFVISDSAMYDVLQTTLKSFTLNRCSSGDLLLDSKVAGIWTRKGGHSDLSVSIHESAVSGPWQLGDVVPASKGWYDAGDYNKYVVNAGITTYAILATYERFSFLMGQIDFNIPESNNSLPDILDEALWNLRWMQGMQDPFDGGVWHKLTSKGFTSIIMPENDESARFMVLKSTAATYDLAAVMAQASRVFKKFDWVLPGFADSCLVQAEKAWLWAEENPSVYYSQPSDIQTGEYGDGNVSDERAWAAAELYITTGNDDYYNKLSRRSSASYNTGWNSVYNLGLMSLSFYADQLQENVSWANTLITSNANGFVNQYNSSPYKSAYGNNGDFFWGSNANNGTRAMMLLHAYYITENESYYNAAMSCLDYTLGKNPTNYSFITGVGSQYPQNPHHRISDADGILEPVPGMVVGGVNSNPSDPLNSTISQMAQAKRFIDNYGSYSTNEPAINYTAPYVFVTAAAEAKQRNIAVGLNDYQTNDEDENLVELYPNPTSGSVQIASKFNVQTVSISSTDGRFIDNYSTNQLDLTGLEKGIYILNISTEKGTTVKKLIIE